MNRTLTAAVALAAGFGMAGLAQAQMNTGTATPSNPMMTQPQSPGASGTPAAQNPDTITAPGSATNTYGVSPQASSQTNQMDQGTQASPPQIQQAQQQLKSAGLYRGAIDGVMGPETQTALSRFQREQGLPQTAQLDPQTLGRLSGPTPNPNGQTMGGQSSAPQSMGPQYPAGTQNPAAPNTAMPGGTNNR
jgi:peptidoglycan hydrolase-like protein with peptidoglycan-binding domain